MKILITGGAGFIGTNLIRYLMEQHTNYHIINLDGLTYAGNPRNLKDIEASSNYTFIQGSTGDKNLIQELFADGIDAVINLAAESHVDKSIQNPGMVVDSNVLGTHVLMETAAAAWRKDIESGKTKSRFIQVSTVDVYGATNGQGDFKEESPLAPISPYAASKAAADLMGRAFFKTYGLPVMITRCSNNFGPFQYPEKLIPLTIIRALSNQSIKLHGNGLQQRDWLYVIDHCSALDAILHHGQPGEVYNIGGKNVLTNLKLVRMILAEMGKPETLIKFVEESPGRAHCLIVNTDKINRQVGWKSQHIATQGIKLTVQWYLKHRDWWQSLLV